MFLFAACLCVFQLLLLCCRNVGFALITVVQQIGKGHLADRNRIKVLYAPLVWPTFKAETALAIVRYFSSAGPRHQPDE